jgi:hypothetical protein
MKRKISLRFGGEIHRSLLRQNQLDEEFAGRGSAEAGPPAFPEGLKSTVNN